MSAYLDKVSMDALKTTIKDTELKLSELKISNGSIDEIGKLELRIASKKNELAELENIISKRSSASS